MKVLIVSTEFPPGPGGIASHAFHLATEFTRLGWTVQVAAPQDYTTSEQVTVFNRRVPFQIGTFRDRRTALLEGVSRAGTVCCLLRSVDVTIATGPESLWLARVISALFQKPWIGVGHGTEFASGSRRRLALTRGAVEASSGMVCVSRYTEQRMLAIGARPRRRTVIHNGGDPNHFTEFEPQRTMELRRSLRCHKGQKILLSVGHVSRRKGADVVVSTLPLLVDQGHDVHYFLVGLPTQSADIEDLARRLGVADRVHVRGAVPNNELPGYFNACDVHVLLSRETADGDFEGFGIAIIEAALCGVPSVGTTHGGLPEAIEDGRTGLLVEPDDVERAAGAIGSLLTDDGLRTRMGAAASERAHAQYTWPKVAERYAEFVHSVVGESS